MGRSGSVYAWGLALYFGGGFCDGRPGSWGVLPEPDADGFEVFGELPADMDADGVNRKKIRAEDRGVMRTIKLNGDQGV
jgi:hypothetical protein